MEQSGNGRVGTQAGAVSVGSVTGHVPDIRPDRPDVRDMPDVGGKTGTQISSTVVQRQFQKTFTICSITSILGRRI